MGGSSWDDKDYTSRVSANVSTHGTAFHYDHAMKIGAVDKKAHKTLDPKGLKVRESRDSDNHPLSNAIMVWLDVTGSMGSVVHGIHEKLPTLMGILTRKNYISDPQILFGAVGDATCDPIPLQVGQFESGAEMEGDLSHLAIPGGGGGQMTESYELAAYVGARKTSIDCLEKRGKKGYCFIIGDEMPYSKVHRRHVNELIGVELEEDIPAQQIFDELREKYNVFFILPGEASYGHDPQVIEAWGKLLDSEHVLQLPKAEGVAELIATQIGMCEGTTDIDAAAKDLEDHGTSHALVKMVTSSVSRAYSGGSITKVPAGALAPSTKPSRGKRL